MFDINFISKPGVKENSSNDTWSFLKKNKFSDTDKEEKKVVKKISLLNNDIFKNYILLILSFSLIVAMSFLNTSQWHSFAANKQSEVETHSQESNNYWNREVSVCIHRFI